LFNFHFFKNANENKERLGPQRELGALCLALLPWCVNGDGLRLLSVKGVVPGSNFGRNQTNK
jgi:hypothetical protein